MCVLVYIISLVLIINIKIVDSTSYFINYNNTYGDDYGIKWIYFPDGEGTPHYVDLHSSDEYEYDIPQFRGLMNDAIEYRLYTRNSTGSKYLLLDNLAKPVDDIERKHLADVLSSKLLKIITHGWLSSANSTSVISLKNAYLDTQDVNVITIDWSTTAESIFYHWVANETKIVGTRIASFLDGLQQYYKIDGSQVHLIGHSLGAHVMGVAASKANFTVDRITGLDPARPLFEYPVQENWAKLDSSDANFVDIIHTCGGILGFVAAIGTVDFYPNNGIAPQPGCSSFQKIFEACSHGRAFDYFEESIKDPTAFPAYQCQSWEEFLNNRCDHYTFMGHNVSRNITGKFYLKTKALRPYGLRT